MRFWFLNSNSFLSLVLPGKFNGRSNSTSIRWRARNPHPPQLRKFPLLNRKGNELLAFPWCSDFRFQLLFFPGRRSTFTISWGGEAYPSSRPIWNRRPHIGSKGTARTRAIGKESVVYPTIVANKASWFTPDRGVPLPLLWESDWIPLVLLKQSDLREPLVELKHSSLPKEIHSSCGRLKWLIFFSLRKERILII